MTQKKMRIHMIVEDTQGPIASQAGGSNPMMRVGSVSRWRCLCDGTIVLGTYDRATTEPWGVRCDACKATAEFKSLDRPKPGLAGGSVDLAADGCC